MITFDECPAHDINQSNNNTGNVSCNIAENLTSDTLHAGEEIEPGTLHTSEDLDLSAKPRCYPSDECRFCSDLPRCCDRLAPICVNFLEGSLRNILYRSKITDNGRYFDFVFNYINLGEGWEIDIVRLPNYRGKNTSAEIIHATPSERGGWKIRVKNRMQTEQAAKRYAMYWADMQAEYIKTGKTPDEQIDQILGNH